MLAGLLFARHEALDRVDTLTATLPFGGSTLIEAQARLLAELGATQIVVLVSRVTPELLGALGRIGRRGVAVDPVRSLAEGAEKLHPLARVLVLADGLLTTPDLVGPLAGEGEDALLVVEADVAPPSFERVGGNAAWAGAARLAPARIAEAGQLPADYDPQSALVRVAAQSGSAHMLLARGALADGHGIEHRASAIGAHGRALLAASVSHRPSWIDRWVIAPGARRALPMLVEHDAASLWPAGAAAALGIAGIVGLALGWPRAGLLLLLLACLPLAIGAALARLRDEAALEKGQEAATAVLAAAGALLLGRGIAAAAGHPGAVVVALALVVAAAIAERAALGRLRRRWWGSPPAYLAVLALLTLLGRPATALVAAALYATATLAAAIEALRREV